MDEVSKIADAVLYEGYVLWPYSKSATKNQRRWTFGGVYPEAHSDQHPDDACVMQTECLLEGGAECTLDVRVRFLHVVARDVARAGAHGLERVEELTVGDEHHVSWDEATEREVTLTGVSLAVLTSGRSIAVDIPAGETVEELRDASGRLAGALLRSWRALWGTVAVSAETAAPGLQRLTVRIVNTTPFAGDDRQDALRQTFCSAHTILHSDDGEFVSLTDPPEAASAAAADVPKRRHLAGAGRHRGRSPHGSVLADHPSRLSGGGAGEPRRHVRCGRDRPAAAPQHPQHDRGREAPDARIGPQDARDPGAHRIPVERGADAPARRRPRIRVDTS